MVGMAFDALGNADSERIVTDGELADLLGWASARTVRRAVSRGELPAPVKLGKRDVWVVGVVRAYIRERAEVLARRLVNL